MERKYYIYAHINSVKNEIFYIGKGCGDRRKRKERSNFWKSIANKYNYVIDILEDNLTEEQAYEREKFYIAKIGRRDLGKGPLVNLNDGGKGGLNISEETREKLIISHTGKKQSQETIQKRISKTKGQKRNEEICRQISERQKGEKNHNYGKPSHNKGKTKFLSEEEKLEAIKLAKKNYRDKNRDEINRKNRLYLQKKREEKLIIK